MAQTPKLVQATIWSALFSGQGLSDTAFDFRFKYKIKTGNYVIFSATYDSDDGAGHNITATVSDDSGANTWPGAATPDVSADPGTGLHKTEFYVLRGASNSSGQKLTITFNHAVNDLHTAAFEWCNCSGVGVSAHSTTAAAPNVQTGSISPTAGSLLFYHVLQNAGLFGQGGSTTVSSWTADTANGWALEGGEFATGGATSPPENINPFAYASAIAVGGAITPKLTTSGTNTYNAIVIELTASSSPAGSPEPGTGIYTLRMRFWTNTNISLSSVGVPFPCDGNLIVMTDIQGIVQKPPTDNKSNTWQMPVVGAQNATAGGMFAEHATTGRDLVLTVPIAGSPSKNTTFWISDVLRAHPTTPLVQSVIQLPASSPATSPADFTDAPDITPQKNNGAIFVACGIGIGPLTGLNGPSGADFLSVFYPVETDFDTFNNADGYAINDSYGSTLTAQAYNWKFPNAGGLSQSFYSTAMEFRPESDGPIDRIWEASSGAVAAGTTSLAMPFPIGPTNGDMLLQFIASKHANLPGTPTGFTQQDQATDGTSTGADTGQVVCTLNKKQSDGTETGNSTSTKTTETGSGFMGRNFLFKKFSANPWQVTSTNGVDATTGTSVSVTGGADPGVHAGDFLIFGFADVSDVGTAYVSQAISVPGCTLGTVQVFQDSGTTQGDDMRLVVWGAPVLSGVSTGAPTATSTANGTAGNSHRGAGVFVRLRAQTSPYPGGDNRKRLAPLLAQ